MIVHLWASATITGMTWVWMAYLAGVLVGLALTDARPAGRVMLALLWPLGPAAFVVVVAILRLAAMIAFPAFGVGAAGTAALFWWVWA